MTTSFLDKRLLFVTGKGGVGKTTVAAGLGLASASAGRRTIVCEVGDQQRIPEIFRRRGSGDGTEVEVSENLWTITIDPQDALAEWLAKRVPRGFGVGSFSHSSLLNYFVAAAPGASELITIAKAWELAQPKRWDTRNRVYDCVVLDAPASGHGLAMLETPATYQQLAQVGPINRQASKVQETLADSRSTGYLAVALPEEMAINEALDTEVHLAAAMNVELDAIVVNSLYPDRFTNAERSQLSELVNGGILASDSAALSAALIESDRARGQRKQLRRLRQSTAAPVVTLPFVFSHELAEPDYHSLGERLAKKLQQDS